MMDSKRPIVIHSAMSVEIEFMKDRLSDLVEIESGNFIFYEGKINGYPIVLSISGVGTIHTASNMMYVIDKYKPLCVINLGIVGSYNKNIHKSDLIVGSKCLNVNSYRTSYLKEGMGSDYKSWEMITFKEGVDELVYWTCNEVLFTMFNELSDKYTYGNCFSGIIGSGDAWNNEIDRLLFLNSRYGLSCSDMECVSVYMVCSNFNIPAISLKVVSDNIILEEEYDREVTKNIIDVLFLYIDMIIKCKDLVK